MPGKIEREQVKTDLTLPWLITGIMIMLVAGYVLIAQFLGDAIRMDTSSEPPILLRTVLYAVSICSFPVINLLRHIMLRLNQTMPGDKPAKTRYLITVLVSLCIAESIGLYGLILYMLGDNINTLTIFSLLSILAMFLYRPKLAEYVEIIEALNQQENN